ncbi:hypothetical protein [Stenotrophomonas sp. ESTM1D_MKCIP4_1]|uniref:hypothetical protein n=1 Tax=Stenotrophomonas sp. ESTM1D_MKCIP4_1 TaxID=2072414 RepID=UPI00131F1CD8|nr:hypothetical protein [Stenotrophomonas sp. ESTM1D_MKCIP4_1]
MNRSLTVALYLASLMLLHRAVSGLIAGGLAPMGEGTSVAYTQGYQVGHLAATATLFLAAAACAVLGWRAWTSAAQRN